MPITDRVERVPLSQIWIDREARQRREFDVEDILPSIKQRGVLVPIIIDHTYKLIAGERRFTASQQAELPDILCRFVEDLEPVELRLIELEENIKRRDLSWQETAKAITDIHNDLSAINGEVWSNTKTADYIGMSSNTVSAYIKVYEEIQAGNEKVMAASSWRAAYNMIARTEDRKHNDALADFLSAIDEPKAPENLPASIGREGQPNTAMAVRGESITKAIIPAFESPIIIADFHEFAANFTGTKFNFLHCDFPYGIDMQDSEQGNTEKWGGYEDQEKLYWDLLGTLASNVDRLCSTTCHIMFWFSMNYYRETLEFFEKFIPSFSIQKHPIYWHKTDNKGILPDPKRGPRRVTETALIGSRGDRLIVKAVSNTYGAPTSKTIHQSEKSRPMLQHFFQMFVDDTTRMLDPTCGSGNALIAAASLKAEKVLGLEINPEFAEDAKSEYKKFHTLRNLSANFGGQNG